MRCRLLIESLEKRFLLSAVLLQTSTTTTGGSDPGNLCSVGGSVYFRASALPWETNAAGTQRLSTAAAWPTNLTAVGNKLFFRSNGVLWESDGTPAGTVQVPAPASGTTPRNSRNLTGVNGTVYFVGDDAAGTSELWKSDGTSAGTVQLTAPGAFAGFGSLANLNGLLVFAATDNAHGNELWTSDGTIVGTKLLTDLWVGPSDSNPSSLTTVNNLLYFVANDGAHGYELWKTDGTASGTSLVDDIRPGEVGSAPSMLTNLNGILYFAADDGEHGFELWKSDGTDAGTTLVKDLHPGPDGGELNRLTASGNLLYFTSYDRATGTELYASDGTAAGTALLKDVNPGAGRSVPQDLTDVNGTLFFCADDGAHGQELWRSNGTAASTVLVKDISPGAAGSGPGSLLNANGTLYFAATAPDSGRELWQSNGTNAGTTLVQDINTNAPLNAYSSPLSIGSTTYYAENDGATGTELWETDGTSQRTVLLKDIAPGPDSSFPSDLIDGGGTLYFIAAGRIYRSDGTSSGTVPVGTGFFSPGHLTWSNGRLFFTAVDGSGYKLWISDGTTAGTAPVQSGNIAWSPEQLTEVNGTLFFIALQNTTGYELWKSDGTASGTLLVKEIVPGTGSSGPYLLTNVNGRLFFRATDGAHGYELWTSDGTAAGTTMVADINPGPADADIDYLTAVGNTLFFTATDGFHGIELWKSDGTAGGTAMIADVSPGLIGASPTQLINVGGTLFFRADDGTHGSELWRSDGTVAGTRMVKDIRNGAASSTPLQLSNANGTLLFFAFDGGRWMLWRSDGTAAGTFPLSGSQMSVSPSGILPGTLGSVGRTALLCGYDFEANKVGLYGIDTAMPANLAGAVAPASVNTVPVPSSTQSGGQPEPALYQWTFFQDGPDLSRMGLASIYPADWQVFSGADGGFPDSSQPDEHACRALGQTAAADGRPLVLDIESWAVDANHYSPGQLQLSVERYDEIADWIHSAAPSVKLGFYGLPMEQPFLSPLLSRVDFLAPSAYSTVEGAWWNSGVESWLTAQTVLGKPVLPFIWMDYEQTPDLYWTSMPAEEWQSQLQIVADLGLKPIVWGGGSLWDDNSPWWAVTREFLAHTGLPSGRVVARQVFYNDSNLDGSDASANALDDRALAADKRPLFPGQLGGSANYTGSANGLNGVMIDISGFRGPLSVSNDMVFKVGNDSNPAGWTTAPAPRQVLVRPGQGVGGSDRIEIVWADAAISGEWLQIRVNANADTGLASPDVFYFGNNSSTKTPLSTLDLVGAKTFADLLMVAQNFGRSGTVATEDLDGDGVVGFFDLLILARHFKPGSTPLMSAASATR